MSSELSRQTGYRSISTASPSLALPLGFSRELASPSGIGLRNLSTNDAYRSWARRGTGYSLTQRLPLWLSEGKKGMPFNVGNFRFL